ncbi:sulfatase-like hydrolase/transferase [Photobacterium sagamiensis]|uniref:sulfatase-like hydrolase/transferase n=1 Tax=Photobacterium sagamiensis TaxID=2910241 RepID=UPI003D112154
MATAFTAAIVAAQPVLADSAKFPMVDGHRAPNVVVLFADDLGYADAGFQNLSKDVVTPNLDQLAQAGAILTTGYVSAPVCGPSRAGMLTGRYQERFGYHGNTAPYVLEEGIVQGLPLDIPTIGNRFQDAGYTTGMIGKYHDGDPKEYWPHNRGFDEFYGFNNGAANYFVGPINLKNAEEKPNSSIYRNDKLVEPFDDYLTDKFGSEAVNFIESHKDDPFFLYVPFNAIHGPLQAIEKDLARFDHIKDKKRRTSLAMNYNMDKNIGHILDKLKEHKLMEDTIIIFLSDNGGKPKGNASYNKPLRGQKNTLWDGGIRIPFTVTWKGKIPAGQHIDDPVISLDILPTVLKAAGADIKDWDMNGVDIMPRLTGKVDQLDNRFMYWDVSTKAAIRDNDWKLVMPNITAKKPQVQLFKISEDISESNDLVKKHPEQVERLMQEFKNWQSQNEPAKWGWNKKKFPYVTEGFRGKK